MNEELRVSATRTRARRSGLLTAVVAGALLLAGCSGQHDPGSYTKDVKEDFETSCWVETLVQAKEIKTADGETLGQREAKVKDIASKTELKQARTYCSCVLKAVTKKVKFSTFKQINDDLRTDGGKLPKSFTDAYKSCDEPNV